MLGLFKKHKISARESVSVRLEAIGGQGAHSAGKILAEAAVLGMGFTGNHFSSFGSEKRGAPVKSFVRFRRDGKPVRSSAPISRPDVLVIFHQKLLESHPEVLEGTGPGTALLVNSSESPESLILPMGTRLASVATVDALRIARAMDCGINSVMLGALSRYVPEIERVRISEALESYLRKLAKKQRRANGDGFDRGASKVQETPFIDAQATKAPLRNPLPRLGWANAPIGGVIVNPGNTMLRDVSSTRRGSLPLLDLEACIHCGLCDMVCPDYCFSWRTPTHEDPVPRLLGIDYKYCKACEKCIVACPMGAIAKASDTREQVNESRVPRFTTSDSPKKPGEKK